MTDTRIAYGARCSWWDSIEKVGRTGGTISLPCCPTCRGVLFEMLDEEIWWRGVDRYTAETDPQYRTFIEWVRGKCFAGGYSEARRAFNKEARQ